MQCEGEVHANHLRTRTPHLRRVLSRARAAPFHSFRPRPHAHWHASPDAIRVAVALQSGGYVIFFRHGKTEMLATDQHPLADMNDCSKQRNLAPSGVAASKEMGEAIKELKIPIGQILASPYCRCMDTARHAFGRVEASQDLLVQRTEHGWALDQAGERLKRLVSIPPAPAPIPCWSRTYSTCRRRLASPSKRVRPCVPAGRAREATTDRRSPDRDAVGRSGSRPRGLQDGPPTVRRRDTGARSPWFPWSKMMRVPTSRCAQTMSYRGHRIRRPPSRSRATRPQASAHELPLFQLWTGFVTDACSCSVDLPQWLPTDAQSIRTRNLRQIPSGGVGFRVGRLCINLLVALSD